MIPRSSEYEVSELVTGNGQFVEEVRVAVDHSVISLLSDQLYSSPLKAIEELVVNSWDADATVCRIHTPGSADAGAAAYVAVIDNGIGMTQDELRDLWHVGSSAKRTSRNRALRSQIGKFGIGKLASHVVAHQVTYLTRSSGSGILGLTLDFRQFVPDTLAVPIQMQAFPDSETLFQDDRIRRVFGTLGMTIETIDESEWGTWTLVVLEGLREKARELQTGRLDWVLSTAMPLGSGFSLYLNDSGVISSKSRESPVVHVDVTDLETARIAGIARDTGVEWRVLDGRLVANELPSGLRGYAAVYEKSLYAPTAKSEDLGRSYGFFVRVRGRLVNEEDPLFGSNPLSFKTWNYFICEINADDLDADVRAPRDKLDDSNASRHVRAVLVALFNQVRVASEKRQEEIDDEARRKKEGQRNYVSPRLIERPLADFLAPGPEDDPAESEWVYIEPSQDPVAIEKLIEDLYADTPPRRQYTYRYAPSGRSEPLVRFRPDDRVFEINEDHDLVLEYYEDQQARRLLELLVTAEAMLEVYLRDYGVSSFVVQQLLSRRDELLRSLANDRLFSLRAVSEALRRAVSNEHDLEIALVAAMRAPGFVSRQISGPDEPDGKAEWAAFLATQPSFTLEAKSSDKVPSLGNLDFGGLRSHYEAHQASGCLLVSPDYPGGERGDQSQVAQRSKQQMVSCWTIEQLAKVVELAEARHIAAADIAEIVATAYTPLEVTAALDKLLSEPRWIQQDLYRAILQALDELAHVMPNSKRDVSMIAARVAPLPGFPAERKDIQVAVDQLAKSSRGLLHVRGNGDIVIRGSLEELRRRVAPLTGDETEPRRRGVFRRPDTDAR